MQKKNKDERGDQIRDFITDIVIKAMEHDVAKALKKVNEDKPDKYVELVSNLAEFSTPKLQRIESDMSLNVPISISLQPATKRDLLTEGQKLEIDGYVVEANKIEKDE